MLQELWRVLFKLHDAYYSNSTFMQAFYSNDEEENLKHIKQITHDLKSRINYLEQQLYTIQKQLYSEKK